MDATQIVAVSIGGFLILLLLALVFWRRNLTAAEYTFARIVLALAAACLAVVISGFLQVKIKGFIEAGGALAVFVIVFFYRPAALHGSNEWEGLRQMWHPRPHDIHDKTADANPDDVPSALNVVNDSARIIGDDGSLFRPFKTDYGKDYCSLYRKLRQNRYPIPQANSTSDALLTPAAHELAQRIPCPV